MPLSAIGRVSFPAVFEPSAMEEGQKPKYSVCLLFDLSNLDDDAKAKLTEMKAAVNQAAKEAFDVDSIDTPYKGKALRSPFRKSEEKPDYLPPGHLFVRFSSLTKPGVVDGSRQPIEQSSGAFYPGCWAHVTYSVYSYDRGGNRGVAFGLKNLQKVRDGEAFGTERTTPDDDFEVLQTAADDIPF